MGRYLIAAATVFICMFFCATSAFAAEAQNLTDSIYIGSAQTTLPVTQLQDSDYLTKVTASSEATLTIRSEVPVSQIYLIWQQPPNPWDLVINGAGGEHRLLYGNYGAIHEYVKLPGAQTEFVIQFHGRNNMLCEIYAFSDGELPGWVEVWAPPCENADLLLFPAQGGDELLYFGGLIPYYATERGLNVQVAYMTNEWADPMRSHEFITGLYTAGLRAYPIISSIPYVRCANIDAARAIYNEDALFQFEIEQIRRFRPEVVVGHDLSGEGGEGTRRMCAETLYAVAGVAGDDAQYRELAQKYGVWDISKLYLHMFLNEEIRMDWDKPLSSGGTALEMALGGFNYNVSRLPDLMGTGPDEAYDCRKFGLAQTSVGADTAKNDFFENIDLSSRQDSEALADTPENESDVLPESAEIDEKAKMSSTLEFITNSETLKIVGISCGAALLLAVFGLLIASAGKKNR